MQNLFDPVACVQHGTVKRRWARSIVALGLATSLGATLISFRPALAYTPEVPTWSGAAAREKEFDERQARKRKKAEELAPQLNIVVYSPEAYGCKSPAAIQAIAALEAKLQQIKEIADGYSASAAALRNLIRSTTNSPNLSDQLSDASAALSVLYSATMRVRDNLKQLQGLRPCIEYTVPVFQNGLQLGIYLIKIDGEVKIYERFIPTDQITNSFRDRHDPIGFGVSLAYGFTPWNNNVVLAPFVSLDYPNNSVFHSFANGSYLGTTSNFSATAGIKAGPMVGQGIWLYGIAGASVLNETMKINFIPANSSSDATVGGATVGAGFSWHPQALQIAGRPVSLFAEYQHTWWQDAHFNAPAASPFFNYTFRREDDVVKFGVNISLGSPAPAAPAPSFPVKALPSK